MTPNSLLQFIEHTLSDLKALQITVLNVQNQTPLTDYMIIASGTSSRHVKSVAQHLVEKLKAIDCPPRGIENDEDGEWWLVDAYDVVVHIMHPKTRIFYNLEKLWGPNRETLQAALA